MVRYAFSEILVNYHLNEVCNYNCRYCFSKWDIDNRLKREQDISERLAVLNELKRFFYDLSSDNPMRELMSWNKVRINFSGGEPLLISKIDQLIREAFNMGFKPSLVTNGSLFTRDLLDNMAPYLFKIGVSLDSPSWATLQLIGRRTRAGKTYSLQTLLSHLRYSKAVNPDLIIKVNTIVSQFNKDEDFSPLIDAVQPDEWSAIQVLPFYDKGSAISDDDFEKFIDYHKSRYPDLLFAENNDDYSASFLMISPGNNFFSNREQYSGGGYTHSEAIHKVGAKQALSQIDFNYAKYIERHQSKHRLYDYV